MQLPDSKLVRLSDTNLTLESAAEDVRGYKVRDKDGQEIGYVEDLMIDEAYQKVRFLVLAAGGFLGIGEKRSWIPVDAITTVNAEEVHVDTTIDHIKTAPAYDPEIVEVHPFASDVYNYYGVTPYWGTGYIYPPFPFLMNGPGTMI